MPAPIRRTSIGAAVGNSQRRIEIMERLLANASGGVYVRKFSFDYTQDVDTGITMFSVFPGNVLIDYFVIVRAEFIPASNVDVALFHSDGEIWNYLDNGYNPIGLYNSPDNTGGGLYVEPSSGSAPYRQMSQAAGASDDGGHVATVVITSGDMILRSISTPQFSDYDAGEADLYVTMADAARS